MTPAHEPTPEATAFVRKAAAAGITQAQCASLMSISIDSLLKHYREQWDSGRAETALRLGLQTVESAMTGDRDDRRFWLTHQGGWTQKTAPVTVNHKVDEGTKAFLSGLLALMDRPKTETKPAVKETK